MFGSAAASMPLIQSGKLRVLAAASTARLPAMPDLPTMMEAGLPRYKVDNRMAFFAPKGTPGDAQRLAEVTAMGTARWGAVIQSGNISF